MGAVRARTPQTIFAGERPGRPLSGPDHFPLGRPKPRWAKSKQVLDASGKRYEHLLNRLGRQHCSNAQGQHDAYEHGEPVLPAESLASLHELCHASVEQSQLAL
jgi:hypothetical protein